MSLELNWWKSDKDKEKQRRKQLEIFATNRGIQKRNRILIRVLLSMLASILVMSFLIWIL